MTYPNDPTETYPSDPLAAGDPQDPVSVRQARQGKPVLAVLAISLFLAVAAGAVLWAAIADDDPTAFMETHAEAMEDGMMGSTATR